MFSKHPKMKNPLIFLTLALIHATSTFAQAFIKTNALENIDLRNTQVTLNDAKLLCQRVQESRIQAHHIYMWVQVKSTEQPEAVQKVVTPECLAVKYVQCKGEPRYPIPETCGFFVLVPGKECLSTGSGRSRRSVSTQNITLSHSEAVQLCTSMQNLPEESTPLQINYVPIKLSGTGMEKSATLADECVRWTNEPCDNTENEGQATGCTTWKLNLHSAAKCDHLSKFYNLFNSTQLAGLPNPMHHKTDYLHTTDANEENPAYGTDAFADVIECKSTAGTVNCKISPKLQGTRSRRAATSTATPVYRVKRACCGWGRCGRCGSRWSGPRQNCDCAALDPDNSCPNLGLCDTHEYPSGCYGNCGIGK